MVSCGGWLYPVSAVVTTRSGCAPTAAQASYDVTGRMAATEVSSDMVWQGRCLVYMCLVIIVYSVVRIRDPEFSCSWLIVFVHACMGPKDGSTETSIVETRNILCFLKCYVYLPQFQISGLICVTCTCIFTFIFWPHMQHLFHPQVHGSLPRLSPLSFPHAVRYGLTFSVCRWESHI